VLQGLVCHDGPHFRTIDLGLRRPGKAVVIRIVQVSTVFPRGSIHLSHSPANAKIAPSPTSKQ
jgi:hypothetical protein